MQISGKNFFFPTQQVCFFLLLSIIPYVYSTVYLTIYLLKNTWVVSSSGLFRNKAAKYCCTDAINIGVQVFV